MEEMEEVWKVYKETNGWSQGKRIYEISNYGRIKINGEIYKPNTNENGYAMFSTNIRLHRAVAELFVPNPENKHFVDHINTIIEDNRSCNLRWVTAKENRNNPLTKQHNREAQIGKHCGEKNPTYGKHWKLVDGKRVYY